MKVYWISEAAGPPALIEVEVVCTSTMIRTLDTSTSLPGEQRQLEWPTHLVSATARDAWEGHLRKLNWVLLSAKRTLAAVELRIREAELLRVDRQDS